MDPANDVQELFQIPNSGFIRKIIPNQPLRAKEVGVLCSKQIETFDLNLGQGSLSVNSKRCALKSQTLSSYTTNNIKKIPLESKDSDGSLSHRQSISQKKKKSPLSQNLQRRLKKAGASR